MPGTTAEATFLAASASFLGTGHHGQVLDFEMGFVLPWRLELGRIRS